MNRGPSAEQDTQAQRQLQVVTGLLMSGETQAWERKERGLVRHGLNVPKKPRNET